MGTGDTETLRLARLGRRAPAPRPAGLLRFHPAGSPPVLHFHALLRDKTAIGRCAECEIRLPDDPLVSRIHARILRLGSLWSVEDCQSANGLHVNGRSVQSCELRGGEVLRVGSSLLRFLRSGTAEADQEHPVHTAGLVAGPALEPVLALLRKAGGSDLALLLTGETGTGKDLAARFVHESGARRRGPFVPVNCSAIPGEIIESELFGHVKGAFTGASSDAPGLVRQASGGTLFLDEIGELSPESQAKLLRVLQDRRVRPVGGARAEPVDVRVICATNRDLGALMKTGAFRPDLYARIAEMAVELPPLRERVEEIPALVDHFLRRHGPAGGGVSVEAMEGLCCRSWPLNVRQLESAVRRALLLAEGSLTLGPELFEAEQEAATEPAGPAPPSAEYRQAIRIWEALRQHSGDPERAAAALGISRSQLYRRAKKYGIVIADFRG